MAKIVLMPTCSECEGFIYDDIIFERGFVEPVEGVKLYDYSTTKFFPTECPYCKAKLDGVYIQTGIYKYIRSKHEKNH